ncbi:MAG: hypothetical protein B7Z02_14730 [Rhodobacterales bacterium 32-67-9]|nr:MAG: hypothetical protein B7Z02_14730 [Rhodobacterales bacterium 32-67-9]
MRSSKSRSRSKSNRQRSLGNIVNRVFDSSGPEGKVRGTPQQIIDKYLMLARDAQLSNDRVAEQNFLQHAEHYTRMLGEAQREMTREQEQRQAQGEGGPQGGQNHHNGGGGQPGGNGNNGGQGGDRSHQRPRYDDRGEREQPDLPRAAMAPLREDDADDGPGLVETPEARQRPAPKASMMPDLPQPDVPDDATAKSAAAKKPGRAPRKPREKREKTEAKDTSDKTPGEPSASAAE